MGLLLVSCDRLSGDDNKASIVGTWQVIKEEYYKSGELVRTRNWESYDNYFIFKDSGQLINADEELFQYSIKGNTVTTTGESGTETFEIIKLTSKELVVKIEESSNTYLMVYFRRVSGDGGSSGLG